MRRAKVAGNERSSKMAAKSSASRESSAWHDVNQSNEESGGTPADGLGGGAAKKACLRQASRQGVRRYWAEIFERVSLTTLVTTFSEL